MHWSLRLRRELLRTHVNTRSYLRWSLNREFLTRGYANAAVVHAPSCAVLLLHGHSRSTRSPKEILAHAQQAAANGSTKAIGIRQVPAPSPTLRFYRAWDGFADLDRSKRRTSAAVAESGALVTGGLRRGWSASRRVPANFQRQEVAPKEECAIGETLLKLKR